MKWTALKVGDIVAFESYEFDGHFKETGLIITNINEERALAKKGDVSYWVDGTVHKKGDAVSKEGCIFWVE